MLLECHISLLRSMEREFFPLYIVNLQFNISYQSLVFTYLSLSSPISSLCLFDFEIMQLLTKILQASSLTPALPQNVTNGTGTLIERTVSCAWLTILGASNLGTIQAPTYPLFLTSNVSALSIEENVRARAKLNIASALTRWDSFRP